MKMVTFLSLRRQVDMNMCVRLRVGNGKKENYCVHCDLLLEISLLNF